MRINTSQLKIWIKPTCTNLNTSSTFADCASAGKLNVGDDGQSLTNSPCTAS